MKEKKDVAHPVRKWSNLELKKIAHLFTKSVVNVSGWEDEDKQGGFYKEYFFNCSSYSITNFPIGHRYSGSELNEVPLDLTGPLPDSLEGAFDVVLNHTTLEHIFDVFTAFSNLCLMTSDICIVVVPFIQQQHEAQEYNFKDYWRFTPSCLRELFAMNGMSVVYESCNNVPGGINYLFFVGSKCPDDWRAKMPKYEPLSQICPWVG